MKKAEIKVFDAEPLGEGIIERLEKTLEQARAGELSSLAMAFVYRDGTTGLRWSDAPSLSCLLGAVTRLQFAILKDAEG